MTDPGDTVEKDVDAQEREQPTPAVQPLERTAPVYVESRDGYVDIRQPSGDPTLYTPEEARDIAHEILSAAEASERGREERADADDET